MYDAYYITKKYKQTHQKIMKVKIFIATMLIVCGLICPTICFVKGVQFNKDCADYLLQTGYADSPELALCRLDTVIEYIEAHNLTKGYTSILRETEDENIESWYKRIIVCRDSIESCLYTCQLGETNVLKRVWNIRTDRRLIAPRGIYLYPNNKAWFVARLISYLMIIIGIFWIRKITLDSDYLLR